MADSTPPFPGYKTIASTKWDVKASAVQNWREMLTRWDGGKECESDTCTSKGWAAMVAQVKAAGDLMAQAKMANTLINNPAQHPYVEDIINWKKQEYWATPYEFLKKSGDTEDFAIAKYFLLRAAGVPADAMQIIAVRLKTLGGIGHAILSLVVKDQRVILDNRVPTVLDVKLVQKEFQPQLGINENNWWVYLPAQ